MRNCITVNLKAARRKIVITINDKAFALSKLMYQFYTRFIFVNNVLKRRIVNILDATF